MRKRLIVLAAAGTFLLLPATPASAHPLGNFTVNSFSALRVQPSQILVDHVTDRAEIPTQQLTSADDPISKNSPPARQHRWSIQACRVVASELTLTVDGRHRGVAVISAALRFPPGAGGLPTSRLTCRLTATGAVSARTAVAYQDRSDDGRIGWHEIIALGDQTTLTASDVPSRSVSRALTAYPTDLLSSPLRVKTANLVVSPAGAPAGDPLAGTDEAAGKEQARGVDSLTVAFTNLVGRHRLSIGVGLLAIALALILGAFHAFAPGHGKTVMAAYLVADRGSLRQVSLIGLSVTATHTLGVLVLGVLLSTFATFAPEKVYPWLGVGSGVLLLSIGTSLLRSAWRRRVGWAGHPALEHQHDHDREHPHQNDHDHGNEYPRPHQHGHTHGHGHPDEPAHPHPHPHPQFAGGPNRAGAGPSVAVLERPGAPLVHSHGGRVHTHAPIGDQPIRLRNLLSMGLAGGLVPSPSALVVLVGAIALHRAWFGVILVIFYGAGMALTLVAIGFVLSRLRGRVVRRLTPGSGLSRGFSVLPLMTAGLICIVGTYLAIRGLASA